MQALDQLCFCLLYWQELGSPVSNPISKHKPSFAPALYFSGRQRTLVCTVHLQSNGWPCFKTLICNCCSSCCTVFVQPCILSAGRNLFLISSACTLLRTKVSQSCPTQLLAALTI